MTTAFTGISGATIACEAPGRGRATGAASADPTGRLAIFSIDVLATCVMLEAAPFRHLLPWQIFEKGLLVAVLLDLALGGNGYLTQIDGIRLREIFYVLCLGWVALRLVLIDPVRLDARIVGITVFFVAIAALDAAVGYAGGNEPAAILAELKPLSYFPMLLFFALTIRKRQDVSLVACIVVASGFVVGAAYLLLLLAATTGFVDYVDVFQFLQRSDEFIFRHNPRGPFVGFFYKGVFYTCVAAIFLLFDPFRKTKLLAAIAVIAIAMTLTRGLGAALLLSLVAGAAMNRNWRRTPVLIGYGVLLAAILFVAVRSETAMKIGSRDLDAQATSARPGDAQRMEDIRFVFRHTTVSTALVGHGLGAPIGGRSRIELTYLEIFYKQGLLGLAPWMFFLAYSFLLYLRLPTETRQFGLAFLLSSLFVAVATATNTFMTGSIGMAVVFIAAASLLVLSRERPHPMPPEDWYGIRRRTPDAPPKGDAETPKAPLEGLSG